MVQTPSCLKCSSFFLLNISWSLPLIIWNSFVINALCFLYRGWLVPSHFTSVWCEHQNRIPKEEKINFWLSHVCFRKRKGNRSVYLGWAEHWGHCIFSGNSFFSYCTTDRKYSFLIRKEINRSLDGMCKEVKSFSKMLFQGYLACWASGLLKSS